MSISSNRVAGLLRRRAAYHLYGWACNGPLTSVGRRALSYFGNSVASLATFSEVASETGVLFEASASSIMTPHYDGRFGSMTSATCPSRSYFLIENALASAFAPGVIARGAVSLPVELRHGLERQETGTDGLFFADSSRVVAKIDNAARLDLPRGIHCGGAGADNYYHFVLECLCKAWLSERLDSRFDDFPLIVPRECRDVPQFAELLGLFAKSRSRVYLERGAYARVDKLVVFDDLNAGPFNLKPGLWPKSTDYLVHDNSFNAFLREVASRLIGSSGQEVEKKRLFLARSTGRRNYNQSETIASAKARGFEPVFFERLPVHQQATLLRGAEAVIGPSGAAWVGLIFCAPGTIALSWLPPLFDGFCAYSHIAYRCGVDLRYIVADYVKAPSSSGEAAAAPYYED